MKNKGYFKLISIILALILVIASTAILSSCESREVPSGKLAETVVGTVNGKDVYYDELYFLASNYLQGMKNKYGNDKAALNEALNEAVKENITANYEILALCEKMGLSLDDEGMEDEIQTHIDLMIQTDFQGHRSFYKDALESVGLTDRYVRFTTGVDILYSKLPSLYGEAGLISTDDEVIIDYVKENFVRVWHFMIANDAKDNAEDNRERAEELLAALRAGDTTMYDVIGGKYNEDLAIPAEGYCFARGSMEKAYEDAAFDLEVGEYSDVVESFGENGSGEYLSCYYVIQRLSISDEYIDMYFDDLAAEYQNSIISTDLENVAKAVEFVPNDFYATLDLSDLEIPKPGIDPLVIVCVAGGVVAVAAIAAVAVLVVKKHRRKYALTK